MSVKQTANVSIIEQEALSVLRMQYDNLFSAGKKIADYVLSNPEKAVDCNVSELAKASGVSDATVVRMCHQIGYTGYYQFRIALSKNVGQKQLESKNKTVSKEDNVFGELAESINSLDNYISDELIKKCVELIKKAHTVHVVAVGNTMTLSQYLGFRLERMGIRSSYVNVPEYYINHINLSHPDDIILAVSKSGISKTVIRALELARERGLKSIVITGAANSEVANMADISLVTSEKSEPFSIRKSYVYLKEFAVIEAILDYLENEDKNPNVDVDRPESVLSEYKM